MISSEAALCLLHSKMQDTVLLPSSVMRRFSVKLVS